METQNTYSQKQNFETVLHGSKKVDEYEKPVACGKSVNEIIKIAAEISKNRLGYKPEKSLRDIIESNGGRLIEDSPLPFKGYTLRQSCIVVEKDGKFTIYTLSRSESANRRFDIAHELGHYFLHYKLPNEENYANKPQTLLAARSVGGADEPEESEANYFALAFLIDKELFKNKYKEFYGDEVLLGDYFKVVPRTVMYFGKSLGDDYFPTYEIKDGKLCLKS
ncbi:MAG: ImmA/IrrE family metallo-endopeptidase [Candidatus Pacebacteria bacterium]|nr:ImmA/IrrE family metallo-endopeptidase [Candidatus Paceibacterota bacterium]